MLISFQFNPPQAVAKFKNCRTPQGHFASTKTSHLLTGLYGFSNGCNFSGCSNGCSGRVKLDLQRDSCIDNDMTAAVEPFVFWTKHRLTLQNDVLPLPNFKVNMSIMFICFKMISPQLLFLRILGGFLPNLPWSRCFP